MLTRKICMIGDFAVGKTSLVSRFVHSTFSDQYLTTVGVKVDSRLLELPGGEQIKLILWDIAGENTLGSVEKTYLAGAAGYLLVCDSTRRQTFDTAIKLQGEAEAVIGPKPFVMLTNKSDLSDQQDLDQEQLRSLQGNGWEIRPSSAKLGSGVEEAFVSLGERLKG
jgi:small GTP-binding protein